MLKFEQVRLDPSPGDIVELLSEAVTAANKRCRTRLLEDNPAKWRKGANQFQASREGFEFWRGGRGGIPATQVQLSWWTDPLGRKHAVVRGRRCEFDGARDFLDRRSLLQRPPLWHCYPARIFRSRVGESEVEYVAVCGCGAAGTLESLNWMGDTCGPCHDLKEERGESALAEHRIGILSGPRSTPSRIAISPNGMSIALSDHNGKFHLWSLPDETRTEFQSDYVPASPEEFARRNIGSAMGFTADSNFLINDYFVIGEQIVGLHVSRELPEIIPLTAPGHAPQVILPWKGRTFLRIWSDQLEWIDAATRETVKSVRVPMGNVWQAIPSTDFSRLFVKVGNRCTVIDPDDGHILFRPDIEDRDGLLYREEMPVSVAFAPDFRRLVVGLHMTLHLLDGVTGRPITRRFDRENPFSRTSPPESIAGVFIEPDGAVVWCGGRTGSLNAYAMSDLAPLASFSWHLSGISDMAVSPDGQNVVTAGRDGQVKFWPVDRLRAAGALARR